ncbi:MAG: SDR family NAD(P)-dependent oxidoreductase [Pseudomonadota bacterium]
MEHPSEQRSWTVITGSTGGIATEIVKILAKRGDALVLVNRGESRAKAQRDDILKAYPELPIELVMADFMDTTQLSAASEKILALPGRIDALYNNSGVLTGEKVLSAQGFESHFAVNTLAPFILIRGLADKMARPEGETPGMIVNFSSSAVKGLKTLDLENLTNPETVGGLMTTYAQTKLAVTALAPALADELKQKNIYIRAIDPGATRSKMTTGGNSGMPKVIAWLAPLVFAAADRQAAKIVDSAAPDAHGGRTGIFVANRKERAMPAPANDQKTREALVSLLAQAVKA